MWIHRDTVTICWGPLSCHSSASITSSFSMIMHSPMSQVSVLNSWKLKMTQFFHGLHIHQTCHPLSMFGMLWIDMYKRVFQFLPISRGVGQHTAGHNQQLYQLYVKEMCRTAWGKLWSYQILTDFFYPCPYLFFKDICDQQMHIFIPSHVKSID
jgi:hypothetical protein